jgi:hypothetical protein
VQHGTVDKARGPAPKSTDVGASPFQLTMDLNHVASAYGQKEYRRDPPNRATMNRKQRTTVLIVLFWVVVLGAAGAWLYRADRQERLNQQLIVATKCRDVQAALLALERGADANARDEPGVPVWERLRIILWGRRGVATTAPTALLVMLDYRKPSYDSFAKKEAPELVSALLAYGARIDVVDQEGCPPLYDALMDGNACAAWLLVEHGANVNSAPAGCDLLAIEIICCHDTKLAELMLQHRVDVDRATRPTNSIYSWPPLDAAIIVDDVAAVKLLLRHHTDPNRRMLNRPPRIRPLRYAEQQHLTEIAKLLREAGARR